jgi:hypothetical protein
VTTEPAVPVPAEAASATTGAPALAFASADGAKAWADTLPFTNIVQLHAAVSGQLQALAAAQLAPRERATLAEVLRDQVALLHTELARRYAGKPQPAVERELEAADQAIALWHALWSQYSVCLKPLLEGDPELAGVKPKLLQRGLYVGKQLVLVHGLARRSVPPGIWQELHAYYRLAEMLECAVTAVSDDLMPQGVGISCYSTYSHALLLGLADPCAMSVKQIELTDRWLAMWARKIFPYAQQREAEGPVLIVDLETARGAALVSSTPVAAASTMRFGYPAKLATSVRGRLKRLQSGANPAELQLGHDCSAEQCTTLLGYLDSRWYQTPRRESATASTNVDLCGGGLAAAYFRVGGRSFDRDDPLGRTYNQKAPHLQALGAITHYDRGREEGEKTWPWERWQGGCEGKDAMLRRLVAAGHRWQQEQLIVVRDDQRIRVGFITRVALEAGGDLLLSLRLYTAVPRCLSVRPLSASLSEEPPVPALLFAETPDDKPSLCLPPRTFSAGRLLRSIDAGPERRFRLTRLLHRGADFERVAFEEPA